MILKYIVLVTLLEGSLSEYVGYNRHKVYKVTPSTKAQLDVLNDVRNQNDYMFWIEQSKIGRDDRIMVAPEKQNNFEKSMADAQMKYEVVIDDVQKAISNQMKRSNTRNGVSDYTYDEYLTLDEIYEWMAKISADHPDTTSIVTIGQTAEGRDIKGIVIDIRNRSLASQIGVIEGGLHAREWISPATCMWIIEHFLTSTDAGIRAMADDVQWHIFPVTNPDGYVYSFTDNRMWRKNRNPLNSTSCAHLNRNDDNSIGIDLNRNFAYKWMDVGGSQEPCDAVFAGVSAFSEAESLALSNYINTLGENGHMLYYLSFHSFGEVLLVPYSHLAGQDVLEAKYYADLFEIGVYAMDKLAEKYNTSYLVGTSNDILYPVGGAGFDWAKAYGNIPIVFLFELRDKGRYGFLLPPDQIIPNNEETMDALVEMHRKVKSMGYYAASFYPSKACSTLTSSIVLFFGVLCASILSL